jgi:hypothetical protein
MHDDMYHESVSFLEKEVNAPASSLLKNCADHSGAPIDSPLARKPSAIVRDLHEGRVQIIAERPPCTKDREEQARSA